MSTIEECHAAYVEELCLFLASRTAATWTNEDAAKYREILTKHGMLGETKKRRKQDNLPS